ncbi:DUF1214 domain-containing protein [Roseomonas sp. HJA6]|uniref:DUF1214 domain-containing protein n=1 Tax=Roseomonas alba TaxID=2846776 RepID=A0ABS7AC84_9PROT|nr:DUF1214 domain-containing protein [Neoroseomonas alba]
MNIRSMFLYGITGITPAMSMRLPGIGSQYLPAFQDAAKHPFDGAKHYRVTLLKEIPDAKFWSFTVYDNQTRSMLDTPQRYPRAGSQSFPSPAATADPDGSTVIRFAPTQPTGVARGNWIQTTPGKGWFTTLRLYSPLEAFSTETWRPGEIEQVAWLTRGIGQARGLGELPCFLRRGRFRFMCDVGPTSGLGTEQPGSLKNPSEPMTGDPPQHRGARRPSRRGRVQILSTQPRKSIGSRGRDDRINVFRQHQPFDDQTLCGPAYGGSVVVLRRITLLNRQPRVARRIAFGAGGGKRQHRAGIVAEGSRCEAFATLIPARVGRPRHLDHHAADTSYRVAVRIHTRQQHRVLATHGWRHDAVVHKLRRTIGPPIAERRDPGVETFRRHQRSLTTHGVTGGWRFDALAHPGFHGDQQCPRRRTRVQRIYRQRAAVDARGCRSRQREMRMPDHGIGADLGRQIDVIAARIGHEQGSARAPELVFAVRLHHQRAGVGQAATQQQPIPPPGQVIFRDRVGEGELIGRIEPVAMRCRITAWLGEAGIGEGASRARDVRQHRVIDTPAALILVEAEIEVVPHEATRLRNAVQHGTVHRDPTIRCQRIGCAAFPHQEGADVAHGGEGHPLHHRIARRVGEFVQRTGIEAGRPRNLDPPRIDEAEGQSRRRLPRILEAPAHGERRALLACRGIGERHSDRAGRVVEEELLARDAGDIRHHGCLQPQPRAASLTGGNISLPADPDQGEALTQQETVAGIAPAHQPIGGAVIVELACELPAAVRRLDHQGAIAAEGLGGAQHDDLGDGLHSALRIAWRKSDVGNQRIARIGRVQGDGGAGRDTLIAPYLAEGSAFEDDLRSAGHLEARDLSARRRRQHAKAGHGQRGSSDVHGIVPPSDEARPQVPTTEGQRGYLPLSCSLYVPDGLACHGWSARLARSSTQT